MSDILTSAPRYQVEPLDTPVEAIQDDELKQVCFGEFLAEKEVISRHQLLCALQMQDRIPGVRIGECLAALGYLPYIDIESYLCWWQAIEIFEA